MRKWFYAPVFLLLLLPKMTFAQTKTRAVAHPPGTFVPSYSNSALPTPTPTGAPAATAVPAADPKPSFPLKISYFGEYQGPTLGGNFDFQQTQTPGVKPSYSEWDHYLKIAYPVSKLVTLGTQFRAFNPTDPTASFGFYDQRFYAQWSHMIETPDLDMTGKLTTEIPTTSASRQAGKIVAFSVDAYFEFKTPLRNWSFSLDANVKTTFYNDPVSGTGKNDIAIFLGPYITLDIIPNLQALFEASFDATHNYNDAFYNYQSAGADYFDLGPLITINSHINTNIALRFFTDDVNFRAAAIYGNIGVAL